MIKFPVLTRLSVKGYELYPGRNEDGGLETVFPAGVSVIVGINGVGKTTLLTLMMRLLLGADDWQISDDQEEIGNKKHEISPWKGRGYFKDRVRDGACNAFSEADMHIGEAKVTIARSLDTLEVLSFNVNDIPLEPTQENFRSTIESLSGASFYDFILLLRYVVFFMEDRRSALWDENAQDEILRLLFYPADEAKELAKLSDTIQSENSNYRNIRPYYNNQKKRLESLRSRSAGSATHTQIEALRQQRDGFLARWKDLHAASQKLEDDWEEIRQALEREKIAAEESRLDYERERQNYFASVFPGLDEVANYVLVHLDSGRGCLVCGNKSPDVGGWIHQCVEKGECPVCRARKEYQENIIPADKVADERLERLQLRLKEAKARVDVLRRREIDVRNEYKVVVSERETVRTELATVTDKLKPLEGSLPPGTEDIKKVEDFVEEFKKQMDEHLRAQHAAEESYLAIRRRGNGAVEKNAKKICEAFQRNARSFIAETCELVPVQGKRKFAQDSTQEFPMPRFNIRMTSGVYSDRPHSRVGKHSVSESQREFLDLAFRMALIEVASDNQPAMLVLETPEASLDTVFITRAGRLLAEFSAAGSGVGNRVVVSSNLNREGMIPALFGFAAPEDYERWFASGCQGDAPENGVLLSLEERQKRTLNLLEIAKAPKSLVENKERYEYYLKEAIDPSWSKPRQSGESADD